MIIKIVFYLFFSVSGLILIKTGGNGTNFFIKGNIININVSVSILVGLCFYILSFILWITILKEGELSYLFSLVQGLSYICVMISSFAFLHEEFNTYKVVGAIVILLGIMLINYSNININ